MDDYGIIVKPLVTEQSMHLANIRGAYSFQVDKRANKAQVKRAVEKLYGVRVTRVNTANRKGKVRRRCMNFCKTPGWKKAVVYLEGDQHIDLF